MTNNIEKVISLLSSSYSCFHNITNIQNELLKNNFIEIKEFENFKLEQGKNYFVKRNDSSLIAFKIPSEIEDISFLITASHSDSPSYKIKPNPVIKRLNLNLLNVEPYGGMIISTWLDRPLSFAGRVIVKSKGKLETKLVNVNRDLMVIPNLCIHMNREVNSGYNFNQANDVLPIISSSENFDFTKFLKEQLCLDNDDVIVSFDLFLYCRDLPKLCGENSEFLLSPKEDDLTSAYSSLLGFLQAKNQNQISVFTCFDNEEVGSLTRQGANSTFLKDILSRIVLAFKTNKDDYQKAIAKSILLSIDNAHANHPNHLDVSDQTTSVCLNKGIVIKYNANQSYTSDSLSSSIVKYICDKTNLKYQEFTNKNNLKGGSTLGNISNSEVSLLSCDIGLPQLAMHSINEMCGVNDIDDMVNLAKEFYSTHINLCGDRVYFD